MKKINLSLVLLLSCVQLCAADADPTQKKLAQNSDVRILEGVKKQFGITEERKKGLAVLLEKDSKGGAILTGYAVRKRLENAKNGDQSTQNEMVTSNNDSDSEGSVLESYLDQNNETAKLTYPSRPTMGRECRKCCPAIWSGVIWFASLVGFIKNNEVHPEKKDQ